MNNLNPYIKELISAFENIDDSVWTSACEKLYLAHRNKANVWIGGNGGNAANANHFATDWNKGLYFETGAALKSHTLWENPSLVSAFANDLPFDQIYSNQLRMWSSPGDIVVLMSAGGVSKNIIAAAETAKFLGLDVIGLTGGRGLEHDSLYDIHIHVPSNDLQVVEDVHATFGHVVYKFISKNF